MRRLNPFALALLAAAATAPAATADTIPLIAGVGVDVGLVGGLSAPVVSPLPLSASVVLGSTTTLNPVTGAGGAADVTLGLGAVVGLGSPAGTGGLVDLDALVAVDADVGAAGSVLPVNLGVGVDLGLGITLPNLLGCDPCANCSPPVCTPPVWGPCDPGCPPSAVPAPPGVVLALAALPVYLGRLVSRRKRLGHESHSTTTN